MSRAPPALAEVATMRDSRALRRLIVVLAVVILAACEASSPSGPSRTSERPLAPTPGATSPAVTAAAPTPTSTPGIDPAPDPLVLGGTWVRPKADGRVTSYAVTLSARPTATGDGVTTFTRVVFSATWPRAATKTLCKATKPGANGAWSCKANLLALGVPPGKVTLSFDVVGAGVPVAHSPDGPRRITYAVEPPKPTGTRLQQIEQPDTVHGDNHPLLHRVRWSAPAGYADEFLVYETFECPRPSTKANSGTPCFVAGTPVDTSMLQLRATTTGEARSVRVRLWEGECIEGHGTILLRARNAYGRSAFAIVEAAHVIWVPPGDMIC
jgi:hypothetical protein